MSGSLSIESLSQEFDSWRTNKSARSSRIPKGLRDKAVAISKKHPRSKVIKQLRINASMLRDWEKQKSSKTGSNKEFFTLKPNNISKDEKSSKQIKMTLASGDKRFEIVGDFDSTEILAIARSHLGGES